jgi:hypothetical protein
MFSELQQASFDEGVCIVSERADQPRLLTAKVFVHVVSPDAVAKYGKYQ